MSSITVGPPSVTCAGNTPSSWSTDTANDIIASWSRLENFPYCP